MDTQQPTPQKDFQDMTDAALDDMLCGAFKDCKAPQAVCDVTIECIHQEQAVGTKSAKIHRFGIERIVAAAAAILLVGICLVGYGSWQHVVTIVSIDVNPSIELSLNRYERVVDVRAVNDDAQEIVERIDVMGMTCEDAVLHVLDDKRIIQAVDQGMSEGYTQEESAVAITVVPRHHAGHYVNECNESAQRAVDAAHCPCQVSVGDDDEYDKAQQLGLSVGKYRMYELLKDSYPGLTAQEVSSMSMRELRAMAGQGCDRQGHQDNHHGQDTYSEDMKDATDESVNETTAGCNGQGHMYHHGHHDE